MKKFYQPPTKNTPEIQGDHNQGSIFFKGNSFPEDYQNVFYLFQKWFKELQNKRPPKIEITFELSYLNSTTAIFISELINQLKSKDSSGITINWIYDPDDFDTKMIGEDLLEIYGDCIVLKEKQGVSQRDSRFATIDHIR